MIGKCESMETAFAGSLDEGFRTAHPVPGKERVHVRVDSESHGGSVRQAGP